MKYAIVPGITLLVSLVCVLPSIVNCISLEKYKIYMYSKCRKHPREDQESEEASHTLRNAWGGFSDQNHDCSRIPASTSAYLLLALSILSIAIFPLIYNRDKPEIPCVAWAFCIGIISIVAAVSGIGSNCTWYREYTDEQTTRNCHIAVFAISLVVGTLFVIASCTQLVKKVIHTRTLGMIHGGNSMLNWPEILLKSIIRHND